MSSGLSMTSVNKIKELAEAKEYSLAVEILDSQDLEKSLNPQFLRVCGEVYENVGRTKDARNMYVKAHVMGPESNRILFSIISFYLKRGYFGLAEQYAEQYRNNAKGAKQELKNIDYVLQKANHAEYSLLEGFLEPYYSHNMDEDWSYELFLLHTLQGHDTDVLATDYQATFRRSERSEIIQQVTAHELSAEELFWVYADAEQQDRDPEEEEIRQLEKEQLKKDYLRMHPAEMSEDTVEDTGVSEDGAAEILEEQDTEQKFKSFLKRKFRKKSSEEAQDSEEEESAEADEKQAETEGEAAETESSAEETADAPAAEIAENTEEKPADAEAVQEAPEEKKEEASPVTGRVKGLVSQFTDRGKNRGDMQELTPDPIEDIVSYDFDDGFAAESDTISDLAETEKEAYQNPFDLINAYKINEKEKQSVRETYGQVPKELKDTIEAAKREAAAAEAPAAETEAPVAEEPEIPAAVEKPEIPAAVEEPEVPVTAEEEEVPVAEEPIVEEELEEEPIPWEEPAAEEPIVEEEPAAEEPIPWEEPAAEEPIAEEELEEEPIPWEEPAAEEPIAEEEPEEEPIPWEEPAAAEPVKEEPAVEEPVAEEAPKPKPKYELKQKSSYKPRPIFELMRESARRYEEEQAAEAAKAAEAPEQAAEEAPKPAYEPEQAAEEAPKPAYEPEEAAEEAPKPAYEPEEVLKEVPKPAYEPDPEMWKRPIVEEESKKSAFDELVEKESEKLDEGLQEEERLQREAEALLASLGIKL